MNCSAVHDNHHNGSFTIIPLPTEFNCCPKPTIYLRMRSRVLCSPRTKLGAEKQTSCRFRFWNLLVKHTRPFDLNIKFKHNQMTEGHSVKQCDRGSTILPRPRGSLAHRGRSKVLGLVSVRFIEKKKQSRAMNSLERSWNFGITT